LNILNKNPLSNEGIKDIRAKSARFSATYCLPNDPPLNPALYILLKKVKVFRLASLKAGKINEMEGFLPLPR
jgi:hypothetical protein